MCGACVNPVMRTSPSTCRLLTLFGLGVSLGGYSAEGKTVLGSQVPRVDAIPRVLQFGLYSNKQKDNRTPERTDFEMVLRRFRPQGLKNKTEYSPGCIQPNKQTNKRIRTHYTSLRFFFSLSFFEASTFAGALYKRDLNF